jgi:hypothetical protein
MKLSILSAALALGLVACASPPTPAEKAAVNAKRTEAARTIPTCSGEKDCAAKWERAQLWVAKNSDMKLQITTSVLIQTFSAPRESDSVGFTVTKEPTGDGAYRILARADAGTYGPGLSSLFDRLIAFNRAVAAN